MMILWRRYARSGYAPPAFYLALGAGFLALAIWAAFEGDWLVMALAGAMALVATLGTRVMRLLAAAGEAAARKDEDHG